MLKKYFKLICCGLFLVIVSLSCLSNPQVSQASRAEIEGQLDTAGKGWGAVADETTLAKIIQYVVSAFLGLLGIIFLVLIIYSGFNWMTAGGDEEKVTKAKETLTRAVIGLIIITAAYSITYFVFTYLPRGGGGDIGGGS